MPVGSYPGANSYTGNGVATQFAYSFRILDESDLKVTVDAVVQTLNVDYTVAGEGDAGGGDITFAAAPAADTAIVIERVRPYSRADDYQRNGSFDEETVDKDFDALVMMAQQLEAIVKRAFKAPVEVTVDQVLSAAVWAARHGKYPAFDVDGNLTLASGNADGGVLSDELRTVYQVAASASGTAAGGTLLKVGINVVSAVGELESVTLPDATGSGKVVIVEVDAAFPVQVFPQASAGGQINQFGADVAYAQFPRQLIAYVDMEAGHWHFITNLPLNYPIYNNWTAFAGGGQANATLMGYGTNVIRTAATAKDSVKMPRALGGCEPVYVTNLGAASVDIYPTSGDKINGQAIDTPYALPPGKTAKFNDIGPGPDQWAGGILGAEGFVMQIHSVLGINPADSTTYYVGQGSLLQVTSQLQKIFIPRPCRLKRADLNLLSLTLAGTAEASSIYVRKNDTTDILISSAVDNSTVFESVSKADLDEPFVAGDYIEIKWVTPAWVTNPQNVFASGSLYFE